LLHTGTTTASDTWVSKSKRDEHIAVPALDEQTEYFMIDHLLAKHAEFNLSSLSRR
jgi:hypothetical protein